MTDSKLTGADLEDALTERNLPSEGTADEKRAAIAAHDAALQEAAADEQTIATPPAGQFVRVRDARTGHQYTTARVDPEHHKVLDKPAVNRSGKPLPPKPHVA